MHGPSTSAFRDPYSPPLCVCYCRGAVGEDKSIFITGAAAGIGKAAAELFHSRGYAVGLYDIDEAGARALAEQLGERCHAASLDVTDADAMVAAADDFQQRFGRFDALLNNAGVLRMGRFDAVPLEMHHRTIDVNFGGVVNGVAAALPHLRMTASAHGRAHIITMCSASALYGTPDHSTYSATKFAVRGLTEALRIDLADDGIVVSSVLPSYVDTEMVTQQQERSPLVDAMGMAHTAQDVAELIWNAAQGDRVHWFGTTSLGVADRLVRLFPRAATRVLSKPVKG